MLVKFVSVTHAITLPDLEEYNWRSNKVCDLNFVFFEFANVQYYQSVSFSYCHDAIVRVHVSLHL